MRLSQVCAGIPQDLNVLERTLITSLCFDSSTAQQPCHTVRLTQVTHVQRQFAVAIHTTAL